MLNIKFYEDVEDGLLRFAVIAARYMDQWVLCKHRDRFTYECPGGHRESGETILDAAKRELWEETGAKEFDLSSVCVYSVADMGNPGIPAEEIFGKLFYAEIRSFGELPPLEIEKVVLFDSLPSSSDQWTYPEIQPKLLQRITAFCGE